MSKGLTRGVAVVFVLFAAGVVLAACSPYRLAVVSGGSMGPTLEIGDVCVIDTRASVGQGSVVCIVREGSRVIHRVVGLDGDSFVTRGDANPCPDRVRAGTRDLVGVVMWRLRLRTCDVPLARVDNAP